MSFVATCSLVVESYSDAQVADMIVLEDEDLLLILFCADILKQALTHKWRWYFDTVTNERVSDLG